MISQCECVRCPNGDDVGNVTQTLNFWFSSITADGYTFHSGLFGFFVQPINVPLQCGYRNHLIADVGSDQSFSGSETKESVRLALISAMLFFLFDLLILAINSHHVNDFSVCKKYQILLCVYGHCRYSVQLFC